MKHKTKNRLIKKRKGRKTKKMKMTRGGGLFSSMSFGIPGFGSVGKCQSRQTFENGVMKEQECYQIDGKEVFKTVQPDAASGAATKSWYQFW